MNVPGGLGGAEPPHGQEEFEQRYERNAKSPLQVWLFCRLCRCRVQVRTIPRPELPFRCFCGNAATLGKFDVFQDEEEARRFAKTFEDVYQTTKELMRGADMPMPQTQFYSAEDIKKIKAGIDPQAAPDEVSDSSEEEPRFTPEDGAGFKRASKELTDAVVKARDLIERHEALGNVARWAFARRSLPEARRLAYQACESDLQIAASVVQEATRRYRSGEKLRLKFPTFKRLVQLLVEDKQLEKALGIATRAAQLGLPGYEEKIEALRAKLR